MNEWIDWNGGECPVEPHYIVRVETRCLDTVLAQAIDFNWEHTGDMDDIIAYKVVSTS